MAYEYLWTSILELTHLILNCKKRGGRRLHIYTSDIDDYLRICIALRLLFLRTFLILSMISAHISCPHHLACSGLLYRPSTVRVQIGICGQTMRIWKFFGALLAHLLGCPITYARLEGWITRKTRYTPLRNHTLVKLCARLVYSTATSGDFSKKGTFYRKTRAHNLRQRHRGVSFGRSSCPMSMPSHVCLLATVTSKIVPPHSSFGPFHF
ncbi:uncharacterized protein LY89DRAFT_50065 [Mollisia scopiformis]|uniref:Uncharacterized protein n=1 Tax=Mollisia scopiformis TaxID=149040 RepID=A0A194XAV5_MOLSC|nr:uncharacterized protein LY89DRAFT_50065 [Mollisia scopiformis]KUJ17279.1 hypothetical protein LY89DRAFT_50065 [Mollisia scopiformis]